MATDLPDQPESREESYLADIAGQDVELPEKPLSRKEQYLAYIAENGGGGGGGTSNFNQLSNRPKYNGATMTGDTSIPEVKTYSAGSNVSISSGNVISATDTTYSNFTGTDGTAAGASGLVPAPATTDAGKFLKADGTWDTAGGGGVIPVQTTGTSTTDVMSQDATTKMIYPDIANSPYKMVIGEGAINGTNRGLAINGSFGSSFNSGSIAIGAPDGNYAAIGANGRASGSVAIGNIAGVGRGWQSVAIGYNSYANSGQDAGDNVAIGVNSYAGNNSETSTVALGAYAKTTRTGEVNIGTGGQNQGYNSTDYRVLGGVHDPVDAHDAATKGYVDSHAGGNAGAVLYVDMNDIPAPGSQASNVAMYKDATLSTPYTVSQVITDLSNSGNKLTLFSSDGSGDDLQAYHFTHVHLSGSPNAGTAFFDADVFDPMQNSILYIDGDQSSGEFSLQTTEYSL